MKLGIKDSGNLQKFERPSAASKYSHNGGVLSYAKRAWR